VAQLYATTLEHATDIWLRAVLDRSGQLLPAPMLADEWLTGPEHVLRDTLDRERCSLQMFVH
jgi:hypothetical protein